LPNARIALGAALFLFVLTLAGCKKEIVHGLTEGEANEIVVILKDHGIEADKLADKGGDSKKGQLYLISVDELSAVDAKRILIDEELPRPRDRGLMETFATPGIFPTSTEEKARYVAALQGEIATTLKTIPGVVDAKVHLVLPEANPLEASRELTGARAAVLIKYRVAATASTGDLDSLKREHEDYRTILHALHGDLLRLRGLLTKEIAETEVRKKSALDGLERFFDPKAGNSSASAAAKDDARAEFRALKEVVDKRDQAIEQVRKLPKVKELDSTLARIRDVELRTLPFQASIRSIVARAVPRLSEDDVTVEYTKIPPKPPRAPTKLRDDPWWMRPMFVLALAGVTAAMAVGLILLAVLMMSQKKQLLEARQAAAKAATASLGGSMSQREAARPPG